MPQRMPRNLPDGVRSTAVSSVTAAGGMGPYCGGGYRRSLSASAQSRRGRRRPRGVPRQRCVRGAPGAGRAARCPAAARRPPALRLRNALPRPASCGPGSAAQSRPQRLRRANAASASQSSARAAGKDAAQRTRGEPRRGAGARMPGSGALAFVEVVRDGDQRVGVQRQVREAVLRRAGARQVSGAAQEVPARRAARTARVLTSKSTAARCTRRRRSLSRAPTAAARPPSAHWRAQRAAVAAGGARLRVGCGRVRRARRLGRAPRRQRRQVVQRPLLRRHEARYGRGSARTVPC